MAATDLFPAPGRPAAGFEHCRIQPGDLTVGYVSRGVGPLVIFLHGFPDTHRGFLPAMEAVAAAGYRAVAPEPRGYTPTDRAPDGDYRVAAFARDVVGLADALGADTFAIVGHDWGALTAYATSNLVPDRVERMVTAAVPHTGHFLLGIRWRQLIRSRYMLRFQLPFLPEWEIPRSDFAWLDALIREWAPSWQFGDREMRALKDSFTDPLRLKAALAYYRQLPRSLLDPQSRRLIFGPVASPTRMLYGTEDGCIGSALFQDQQKRFTRPLNLIPMVGSGHFMHWEQPEAFARLVVDFLVAR